MNICELTGKYTIQYFPMVVRLLYKNVKQTFMAFILSLFGFRGRTKGISMERITAVTDKF